MVFEAPSPFNALAVAVAVTAVEQRFRPRHVRIVEYGCWWMWTRLRPSRAARMTLGMSQVRASTIAHHLHINGRPVTLREVIRVGENFRTSVSLAVACLANADEQTSVSKQYTGRHNPYYELLVRDTLRAGSTACRATPRQKATENGFCHGAFRVLDTGSTRLNELKDPVARNGEPEDKRRFSPLSWGSISFECICARPEPQASPNLVNNCTVDRPKFSGFNETTRA